MSPRPSKRSRAHTGRGNQSCKPESVGFTLRKMSAYETVVVGTDGSESSLRAVDRAGAIAADHGAKLIVATAHLPVPEEKGRYAIPPGSTHGQDYRLVREAPFYAILRDAKERAHKAGAKNVEEKAIVGAPINALVHLAEEVDADLLVVGNVGLSSVAGRLLGSVPSEVSRRPKTDVLIVHTTGCRLVQNRSATDPNL